MTAYHRGEIAVQERAGLAEQARRSGRAIGRAVPPVAREFLAGQPMIVLGGADPHGSIWATQLTADPGFLSVPDPHTLLIDALPHPDDPLAGTLAEAAPHRPARVGLIAIEPATRRRMRMNGRVHRAGDGLRVEFDQVISNCPKYLQKRRPQRRAPGPDRRVLRGCELSAVQQAAVARADTFFVATASEAGEADASHRGGNPGFVQVLSPTLLRWPDYTGNAMFLTLGNLELNPAAGLLFPDWETGAVLHLSGTAHVVWDAEEAAEVPGAQRLVEFRVEDVREISAASPLRWTTPDYSRFNPPVA
ncbi:pyridoxamine 5'-phosphate oxidase family protein [Streptomyces sp. JJ38]|uniref:pyridoxamine 5'-phosphate oxidase family protein n=1 Tax=Streptomyces sp. JJ38 TaxID=2738128 RepID=UPI001C57A89A|nr:pyridoxamine 5'-phosphate oxidase family protein [Streptomyces sp. JJ38]MBW1598064.1 pyridoxamine 5'-phosphate oxidase family protein [Streptomyces sp. JJ38]